MHEISEEQRFLFDLQGYLILRGAGPLSLDWALARLARLA